MITNTSVVVSTETPLKIALVLITLIFAAIAILCMWFAINLPEWKPSSVRWIYISGSAGMIWMTYILIGLIRFINHSVVINNESITIRSAAGQKTLPWQLIQLRIRETVEIIEVYTKNGKLIYAVSYSASNADKLLAYAKNKGEF